MSDINIWSNVAVDVETALAAAKTISAISKANPAVVSSTAHGYNDGDIVLIKANGMTDVNYLVARVDNKTTDSFELEGVDSTDFDTFTSGTAEKVTFGASANTFQDVSWSGGEAASIVISTVHTDQDYDIPGNRAPLNCSIGSLWDPADTALLAMRSFDRSKTPGCVKFTFATGATVYGCAYMSASLSPGGSAGGPVTTPVSLRFRGLLQTYAT